MPSIDHNKYYPLRKEKCMFGVELNGWTIALIWLSIALVALLCCMIDRKRK